MTGRRVQIVILCEDSQHEVFGRRFLKQAGWENSDFRVVKSPEGKGCASQWVRKKFPEELSAYRQRKNRAASCLIAVIDADNLSVHERIRELEQECMDQGMVCRSNDDCVAFVIPKRNIASWVHHLLGEEVNESDVYRELERESLCQPAVAQLANICNNRDTGTLLPSLKDACQEYNERIRILKS
ncbi:MAG: hypothetical protein PHQ23_02480 [Candidatus Wallbacteria bacterium]|nr:hypothetical protein [Candidatus Wallbacteria bacterium]